MKKTSFTIVELLVVIAIISILGALLFPMLAKSRERAVDVQCRNNIRNLGIAWTLYANSNDDVLPPACSSKVANQPWQTAGKKDVYWVNMIAPYIDRSMMVDYSDPDDVPNSDLHVVNYPKSPWTCPAMYDIRQQSGKEFFSYNPHYGMIRFGIGQEKGDDVPPPITRLGAIRYPAEIMVFADSAHMIPDDGNGYFNPVAAESGIYAINQYKKVGTAEKNAWGARHPNDSVSSFHADGSARNFTAKDIEKEIVERGWKTGSRVLGNQ